MIYLKVWNDSEPFDNEKENPIGVLKVTRKEVKQLLLAANGSTPPAFGKWNWFQLIKNEKEIGKIQSRGKLLKNELLSTEGAANVDGENPAGFTTDTEFQQQKNQATEVESVG